MKFLKKNNHSPILADNLSYQRNRAANNRELKERLVDEQSNFCAYTEKYIDELDATEVEHFNDSIKYEDNYFNYYAVLRKPNLWKRRNEKKFENASFFDSLFFQNEDELFSRIQYIKGEGIYEEINEDKEAEEFIQYLDFNHPELFRIRNNHIRRLKNHFQAAGYGKEQIVAYFNDYKNELSFITAIEAEFDIDLSAFYT